MNDTTRNGLIERIAELADQFACGAAGEPVVYALHGPMDFAEEVIELVTAARDAEIREALNVVSWADIATVVLMADEYGGNYDDLLGQVTDEIWGAQEAALNHIGLHGAGTGGRGDEDT